jgi:hypothetical protein
MKAQRIDITYSDPNNPVNTAVIDVTEISDNNVLFISKVQINHGRTKWKIRYGFPAFCPYCGVRTTLLPYPNSSRVCAWCEKWGALEKILED